MTSSTPLPEELEKLAGSLTAGRKRLLMDAYYTSRWRVARADAEMVRLGLLERSIIGANTSLVTPLGLALRNYLRKDEG